MKDKDEIVGSCKVKNSSPLRDQESECFELNSNTWMTDLTVGLPIHERGNENLIDMGKINPRITAVHQSWKATNPNENSLQRGVPKIELLQYPIHWKY